MFQNEATGGKLTTLIILTVIVIISMAVISPWVSNAAHRTQSLEVLDEIKLSALGLTATVTSTSLLVSAMPDDTGSPIADELADISGLLMLIVCAVYLEKFLLTTTGWFSFSILIPAAAVLFGVTLYKPIEKLRSASIKLLILALLLFMLVPTSAKITSMIQKTFHESLQQTFAAAEAFSDEVENTQQDTESNFLAQLWEGISNGVTKLVDMAQNVLSATTDAVAVLLITACVIPLCTLLCFICVIRKMLGMQITTPDLRVVLQKWPRPSKRIPKQV